MPPLKPVSRRELVKRLRKLGFIGPSPGGKHEYMERGTFKIRIPNPHRSDVSVPLLAHLLTEARISRDDWEKL